MYSADEYHYHVVRDTAGKAFIATVVEFPSLSNIDDSQIGALAGMVDLVSFVLADMEENGEEIPTPLVKRKFSGKISLRMTPEQHRRVATEAAEQGISINQLLVSRI